MHRQLQLALGELYRFSASHQWTRILFPLPSLSAVALMRRKKKRLRRAGCGICQRRSSRTARCAQVMRVQLTVVLFLHNQARIGYLLPQKRVSNLVKLLHGTANMSGFHDLRQAGSCRAPHLR